MLPTAALLVLAAAAVRAAPASDPPPKYNRPLPELPATGIPGGTMFRGWEEVRWHNTDKCLTAPDKPYEGAPVFLSKCTGANNQLWTGRHSVSYDNDIGLYGGTPWGPVEWFLSGDLKSNVPAKLVRYDPLKQTPMWSTPPTNKGRLEVTQYKGTTPKRFYMGYCLEVPKGRAVDCAPLKMAKCTGNKSQRWTHYGENIPASGPPEPAPGEESTEPYE